LAILRRAFAATMKDAAFIADAEKAKLDLNYVSGEEIEKYVDEIYSMPARVKENLQFLMRKTGKN
jgi:tripartite-type tricarboxylate transporter receptor subunit TctC